MRLVGLVIWISLAATSLVGQEVSGAVIKGNCPKDLPEYKQWLERTPSADGGQYVADSARKHKTISRYSKLRLNMSADEIEGLLGKPDFAVSQHLAEPALSDRPATATCPGEVAYILWKKRKDAVDGSEMAVYVFFTSDGKLSWAMPQNIPSLKPIGTIPSPSL